MTLVELCDIRKEYENGFLAVNNVSLTIQEGTFLVLVGPSGCGKSTILRMIAGLESVSSGDILFNSKRMNDVHPRQRDVGMVFQNYALYPHLSVAENIAFPLVVKKIPKKDITLRVNEIASMLNITHLLQRLPKQLSGGQRQRVALGRAIVRTPNVFLFDEPLSNLDAKLRVDMRAEIITLQKSVGTTSIYVTHDHTEAMTMGDTIAVIDGGVVQQVGTPQQIYSDPESLFVAQFIGSPSINVLQALWENADGGTLEISPSLQVQNVIGKAVEKGIATRSVLTCAIRPEFVELELQSQTPNATVEHSEYIGHELLVYSRLDGVQDAPRVIARCSPHLHKPEFGQRVHIAFSAENCLLFSHQGKRLR